jgi:hypothetical protein
VQPGQHDHQPAPTSAADVYAWTGMPGCVDQSSAYPLSAPCACGAWLFKPSIYEPWRHRLPSDVIDSAADQSGGAVT